MNNSLSINFLAFCFAILVVISTTNVAYSQTNMSKNSDAGQGEPTELQQKIRELSELGFFYEDYNKYLEASRFENFSEENLEKAIANIEYLAKNEPYFSLEISNITQNNLKIISRLTSLENLSLWGGEVDDFGVLANIPALETLHIHDVKKVDFADLTKLKSLKKLTIRNTAPDNLTAISQMTQIESLSFDEIGPVNLELFDELPLLIELGLHNTNVLSQTVLKDIKSLRSLMFTKTDFRNFQDLQSLINLERLYISHDDITDLSPLRNLIKLKDLSLSYTKVEDLSPLQNLQNLIHISLFRSWVFDISPLSKLENLMYLEIHDTKVTDVSSFDNHPHVDFSNFSSSGRFGVDYLKSRFKDNKRTYPVPDYPERRIKLELLVKGIEQAVLTPEDKLFNDYDLKANLSEIIKYLDEYPDLTLDLSETFISDLSPLTALKSLKKLNVARTPINDLTPLSKLRSLIELDVSGRMNADVFKMPDGSKSRGTIVIQTDMEREEFISLLKNGAANSNIEEIKELLKIDDTPKRYSRVSRDTNVGTAVHDRAFDDISPLSALKNLEKLTLTFTPIDNIEALNDLTKLTHLDISHSYVDSLAPLRNLKQLQILNASATSILDLDGIDKLEKLKVLEISDTLVSDVSVVSALISLRYLDIRMSLAYDVSVLDELVERGLAITTVY